MNADNLDNLAQFTGTENHYRHPFGQLLYTDGVQYLAENAECYWLIDAIASYQPKLQKIPTFRDMQFWELRVNPNKSAVLICREDSGIPPVVEQQIAFTDFPLDKIDLWVEGGVLLLPSEH